MKLWLDDVRPPPRGWIWARTAVQAIECLARGEVRELSLDHDLGTEDELTGYDVLVWIEDCVHRQAWYGVLPVMYVHSANPVGRKRMASAIDAIERAWENRTPPDLVA